MTRRHPLRLLRALSMTVAVVAVLIAVQSARGFHTQFIALNCNTNNPQPTTVFTRHGSTAVAIHARYEGYQWAGGCWNDNNVDDSPNDPTENPNTGGEGGDCSGFTFIRFCTSPRLFTTLCRIVNFAPRSRKTLIPAVANAVSVCSDETMPL